MHYVIIILTFIWPTWLSIFSGLFYCGSDRSDEYLIYYFVNLICVYSYTFQTDYLDWQSQPIHSNMCINNPNQPHIRLSLSINLVAAEPNSLTRLEPLNSVYRWQNFFWGAAPVGRGPKEARQHIDGMVLSAPRGQTLSGTAGDQTPDPRWGDVHTSL